MDKHLVHYSEKELGRTETFGISHMKHVNTTGGSTHVETDNIGR